jgi:xanthine dehydrogenase accessory factor
MDLIARAIEACPDGVDAALAVVVATRGSVPRHSGAKMVVTAAGERFGTVGGGRI